MAGVFFRASAACPRPFDGASSTLYSNFQCSAVFTHSYWVPVGSASLVARVPRLPAPAPTRSVSRAGAVGLCASLVVNSSGVRWWRTATGPRRRCTMFISRQPASWNRLPSPSRAATTRRAAPGTPPAGFNARRESFPAMGGPCHAMSPMDCRLQPNCEQSGAMRISRRPMRLDRRRPARTAK